MTDTGIEDAPHVILYETSDGFVNYSEFGSAEDAQDGWAKLLDEIPEAMGAETEEAEADTGRGQTELEQLRNMPPGSEERASILGDMEDNELVDVYNSVADEDHPGDRLLIADLDHEYQSRGYAPGEIAGQGDWSPQNEDDYAERRRERDQKDVEEAEADTGKPGAGAAKPAVPDLGDMDDEALKDYHETLRGYWDENRDRMGESSRTTFLGRARGVARELQRRGITRFTF